MRQIVLDTETTGLETSQGHRIIEIGGVELINRKLTGQHFHQYINPKREIDAGAFEVHGISSQFLADKPVFADIADDFMSYIEGADLIIHNAAFDIGFLNNELTLIESTHPAVNDACKVIDSLFLARKKHPGQKNSLDALCKRYSVDNSQRELHGALLDAEILADVYLLMTGGQTSLGLSGEPASDESGASAELVFEKFATNRPRLKVIRADDEENAAHRERLEAIKEESGKCVWFDSQVTD